LLVELGCLANRDARAHSQLIVGGAYEIARGVAASLLAARHVFEQAVGDVGQSVRRPTPASTPSPLHFEGDPVREKTVSQETLPRNRKYTRAIEVERPGQSRTRRTR